MSRKVMMVLMGLEIGGAETHVVELSKELHRQGYEIVVVSNGGVYEKELTDAGIRCYHAPLHRRSAPLMLRSLHILRGVIKKEKPDVVHAHARIPAFLCGILQKRMGFPFVTSAHWVFYVNSSLRRLTNWGERTVAVSDDIREYLKANYGVPDEHISVTINGIDTEKFSPAVSGERVLREAGFSHDRPTISYVSRMDESRALVARHLVEIAPRLRARIPNIQILIAGGGDVFDEIYAQAQKVNEAAGENFVVMTGARTDINEIVAAGDVFVGVSRAALEAMAAAKPVIVAGNEGYIGLFTEDKLALAQESNFCCRGCAAPTPELLFDDLLRALTELDDAQREALGQYGRAVIGQYYSVARMARDCEKAYREVLAEHTHVLISGYYGFRNLGDDAILLALRDRVRALAPEAKMTVLSRRPEETREKYGVEAVDRFAPFAVYRAMKRCTVFISGGGSLLQDSTSTRSLLYYTALIRLAKRCGKKVLFYANGIGPVGAEKNRARVRAAAELADAVTLRDADSLHALRAMGVESKRLFLAADPVYAMAGGDREEGLRCLTECGVPTDRPLLGVSVRFAGGTETKCGEFAHFCDLASQRMRVVFLAMQQGNDDAACEAVRAKMREESWMVSAPYDPRGMMSMLACMDAVVSTRLHSIIFAAHERVPVLGVVYDPKVRSCLASLEMPAAGTLDGFDAAAAMERLDEVLAHRADYVAVLERTVGALEKKARENDRCLAALLEGERVDALPEAEQ